MSRSTLRLELAAFIAGACFMFMVLVSLLLDPPEQEPRELSPLDSLYATVLLIQEDIRATTDAMHRLCLEVAINHRGMTESMAVAHCEVSDD